MSTSDHWKVMWHVRDEVYGLMPDHVEYPEFGEKGFQFKTVIGLATKVVKEDCQKYIELCWGDMTPKPTAKDLRDKGCKFTELTDAEFDLLNRPMTLDEFRLLKPETDGRLRTPHVAVAKAAIRNTLDPAARSLLEVEPGASINVVTTAEDTGDRALVETDVYDRRTEKDRTVVGWMFASALELRRDDEAPPEDSLADIHDVVIDDLSGEAAPPAIEDIDGDDSEDDTARE